MKSVLISQDLSCVGQVSMAVALPVLGAAGLRTAALPTALLSTHTGGFGANTYRDLSPEIPGIMDHWASQDISFDAVYLGYLGQEALDVWLTELPKLAGRLILLDPAMADHGKLYRGFDAGYVARMGELAQHAALLTPNLTEALLLLGQPVEKHERIDRKEAFEIVSLLQAKFDLDQVVLTGVPVGTAEIGIFGFSRGDGFWDSVQARVPGSYFGTGDLFASALMAGLMHGFHLQQAAETAGAFVAKSIAKTAPDQDPRFGPNYAAALPWLLGQFLEK
ncbi:PfkB family carbohydrate kinase [Lactobacillus porci]|uniref:pyridoxal kinase n=1 Tax=Lactobacillus porci TaxID=2012477 RepID=A0A6A8MG25_9LACO|nr:PfkB family carbohydrate kinase [Lactobacillus porci]MST87794.1 pyridoxal kinase [Lactobacillus porci]